MNQAYHSHEVHTTVVESFTHSRELCGIEYTSSRPVLHARCWCGHYAHHMNSGSNHRYWYCQLGQHRFKTIRE